MKKLGNYLSQTNRKRLAKKIRTARRFDSGKGNNKKTWRRNRSLSGYSEAMRVDLNGKIKSILKKRGACKLLDVGCGDGHALAEAKHHYGPHLKAHGLRLYGKRDYKNFSDEMIQTMVDKIMVGSIENYVFKEKYDLIVSFAGGTHYTVNPPLAIEKIANALNVGGEAHLQIKKSNIPKNVVETLESQGFATVISTDPGHATILHIARISKQKANLNKFILKEAKKKINPGVNTKERLTE